MSYDSKADDGSASNGSVLSGTVSAFPTTSYMSFPAYDVTSTTKRTLIQRFPNGL